MKTKSDKKFTKKDVKFCGSLNECHPEFENIALLTETISEAIFCHPMGGNMSNLETSGNIFTFTTYDEKKSFKITVEQL